MNPLLGVLVAALLAQLDGAEGPFVAPEFVPLGACDELWQAWTGGCSPCRSLFEQLAAWGWAWPWPCGGG